MNTISLVEYTSHRQIIRVSKQIRVEKAIMKENTHHFLLVYSSPLFRNGPLNKISSFGEKEGVYNLIFNGILISNGLSYLNQFLSLLYRTNHTNITPYLRLEW